MRIINDIIVHCSASPWRRNDTAADVKRWHIERGFRTIGYHYVVRLDGTVEPGRYISMPGAHCRGHNAHSIGVCYIGGLDEDGNPADTRTPEQRAALLKLVAQLIMKYRCRAHAHHDYAKYKNCPCFDAAQEYEGLYRRYVVEGLLTKNSKNTNT